MVCAGAQAASALSSITVDEAARSHAAEETELLATFPALVADAYDSVQLFAVKLLGVFLERPQWRDVLREPVQPILEEIVATCVDPFPPASIPSAPLGPSDGRGNGASMPGSGGSGGLANL